MFDKNLYILRRYVSYKVFDLENLVNKTITLSAPQTFNDPVDTYFYYSPDDYFIDAKKIMTKEIMDKIRIACFTNCHDEQKCNRKLTTYELLLWTHYANAHKGICLEYEVPSNAFSYIEPNDDYDESKRFIDKISYVSNLAVDYETIFTSSIKKKNKYNQLLKDVFMTKDDAFQYENEFRLLMYDSTNESHIAFPFNYLRKIIFGYRCIDVTKHCIFCLNKKIYDSKLELRVINNKFEEVLYNE